jgi:hypothetical protein
LDELVSLVVWDVQVSLGGWGESDQCGVSQEFHQLGGKFAEVVAIVVDGLDGFEALVGLAADHAAEHLEQESAVDEAEGVGNLLCRDVYAAEADDLVQEAL